MILQKKLNGIALLWITAALWGFAFVAQRAGMQFLGPFTFNGIRFALGCISLLPIAILQQRRNVEQKYLDQKKFLAGGAVTGLVLFAATSLQQTGMIWTTAGKAGFITGLYVILVPLIGMFIGQITNKNTWIGAFLALIGLFFLTISQKLTIETGDLLILLSAIFWAIHVQLINKLAKAFNPLTLSILQFGVCAVLSLISAGLFEIIQFKEIVNSINPLLYGGIISVGIAYTLQVYAQRYVNPSFASIILSFETVFAVIGGWLILNESISLKELAGCFFMLSGFLVVQLKRK